MPKIGSAKKQLPNMLAYSGSACVYIRWIKEKQAFYIGSTINNLIDRYGIEELKEVIYIKEYDGPTYKPGGSNYNLVEDSTVKFARGYERDLIALFIACNFPLTNKDLHTKKLRRL